MIPHVSWATREVATRLGMLARSHHPITWPALRVIDGAFWGKF